MINYFQYDYTFNLESGEKLDGIQIGYSVYGNPDARETIWVCHALSGNSQVTDWWAGLFGEGRFFSPQKYRIICANVLGSCYGTTGASLVNEPAAFPLITVRDIVKAHILLADHLKIDQIDILIGASLGGQQVLEWSLMDSRRIRQQIIIAANAFHSPMGRAFNETQRLALKADQTFGAKGGGREGLKAARAIAMLSYRSYEDFALKQADDSLSVDNYRAASYVRYQGEKFIRRFDPHAYFTLTKAMDSHDVRRSRADDLKVVLEKVKARTLVVGIDSDLLFPLAEQKLLADLIPDADLAVIQSPFGHDAFLINYDQLEQYIREFLYNGFKKYKPTSLKRKSVV